MSSEEYGLVRCGHTARPKGRRQAGEEARAVEPAERDTPGPSAECVRARVKNKDVHVHMHVHMHEHMHEHMHMCKKGEPADSGESIACGVERVC